MDLTHVLIQEVLIAPNVSRILFTCSGRLLQSLRSGLSTLRKWIREKVEPTVAECSQVERSGLLEIR